MNTLFFCRNSCHCLKEGDAERSKISKTAKQYKVRYITCDYKKIKEKCTNGTTLSVFYNNYHRVQIKHQVQINARSTRSSLQWMPLVLNWENTVHTLHIIHWSALLCKQNSANKSVTFFSVDKKHLLEELVNSGLYGTKDSFAVVIQPALQVPPKTKVCIIANIIIMFLQSALATLHSYALWLICCGVRWHKENIIFPGKFIEGSWPTRGGESIFSLFVPNCYSVRKHLRY